MFIPHVDEEIGKNSDTRLGAGRDMTSRLGQNGEEAYSLHRDTFPSRVGAGNKQGIDLTAEFDRQRDNVLPLVGLEKQRMPGIPELKLPLTCYLGLMGEEFDRILGLRLDKIEFSDNSAILEYFRRVLANLLREFCKDPGDFPLLLELQRTDVVIQIKGRCRLDEYRGAAG